MLITDVLYGIWVKVMQLVGYVILNKMIADRYEYELYTNKTLIAVIEEGAFGGTCFREIYFNVNCKWYRKSWKEFD